MRIRVAHSTIYRYDSPVHQRPHTFRLRPRHDGSQRLLQSALEITPAPDGQTECLDQDGNVVLEAWFGAPMEELAVHSRFEVETLRNNPFDFVLAGAEMASLPLAYAEPLRSALSSYLQAPPESPNLREFADSMRQAASRTLDFLIALNTGIFERFRHVVRDDGPPHASDVTLRAGEGTCRDLTVLFCDACRLYGIPARFVSGYEHEAALQDHAYMHAWAEVYLAGGGWRGYDPSSGLAVSTSHVAVAAAADYRLAAPISGSYSGSAKSKMKFTVSMQLDPGA